MAKLRVIHWGTGVIGKIALYYVLQNPEMELVGLVVATDRNAGKDAGDIVGLPKTGIRAIPAKEASSLFALKADALCYCGDAAQRDETEAAREMAMFLERGTNVSTYILISMHDPAFAPPDTRKIIADACAKGGSTFYQGGVDPGFSCGALTHAALSIAGRVDTIMVTEYGNFIYYAVPEISRTNAGFGMPADYVPPRLVNGRVQHWWKRGVESLARMLGHKLDDVRYSWETAKATFDIDTSFGKVEKGSIGGFMWRLDGVAKGKVVATIRHVTRLHADFSNPGWPAAPGELTGGAIYEVVVEGDVNYRTLAFLNQSVPQFNSDVAIVVTGTHAVNAIPAVCAARPGIMSPEDVPPVVRKMPLGPK